MKYLIYLWRKLRQQDKIESLQERLDNQADEWYNEMCQRERVEEELADMTSYTQVSKVQFNTVVLN